MADLLFTDCLKHIAHIPSSLSLLFFLQAEDDLVSEVTWVWWAVYLCIFIFSPHFATDFPPSFFLLTSCFTSQFLAASCQSLSPFSICFCMRLFNLSSHIPLVWFSLFSPLGGRRTARAWGRLIHVFFVFFTFCLYFPSLFLSSLFFLLTTLDICSLALGPNLTYNIFIPDT